jgi:hypothetical protein
MAALIPHLQPNVQFPMELLSAQVATGDLDGVLGDRHDGCEFNRPKTRKSVRSGRRRLLP